MTTGCSSGLPIQTAHNSSGDSSELHALLEDWSVRFKNLYVEFQPNPQYIEDYRMLFDVTQKLGLPYVVANDVHYATKEDYVTYKNIHLIMTKKESDLKLTWLYPWSAQEMNSYFIKNGFPQSFVSNAVDELKNIANMCDTEINLDRKWYFTERPDEVWAICESKLIKVLEDKPKEDILIYLKRLSYEFRIFEALGLLGYLEFCKGILDNCREQDIPYGPGRGSCVGSLVCYLMGITEIDPIEHELSFERFLSPIFKDGIVNGKVSA